MKKLLAITLTLAILLTAIPFTAITLSAATVASGQAGDSINWTLDSEGDLRLTGYGETYNFAFQNVPWQDHIKDIKTATVGEGITVLHQNTFSGASNMTELTLPTTLTDITGNVTFFGCNALERVNISDLDAWCRINFGLVSHQEAACPLFSGAELYLNGEPVTEIVIPEGVTTMWSYQYGTPSLTKLTIPDSVDTVSAHTLGSTKDVEIYISSIEEWLEINFRFSTGGLLDNSALYINNEPLTTLTVPDGITDIAKSTFYGYDKLTYLDLNDVTTVGEEAFYQCKGLTTLDLSGVETLSRYCFGYCEGLQEVYFSSALTETDSSFYGADDVKKLHINDLYHFCTMECSVRDMYVTQEFGIYLNGELITHVDIPEGIKVFDNCAFRGYDALESVNFPEGLTEIGDRSFYYNEGLKSVEFPESLTTIGSQAFEGTELTEIDIPDGVQHISAEAFAYIDTLKEVKLPSECVTIDNYAFSCDAIENIEFPDTLTSIGDSAFSYNKLKDVTIPDGVTYIGTNAFEGNEGLVIHCSIGSYADSYAKENNISVKYNAQSSSVKIKTLPDKTTYNLNETLDTAGLTLEVEFDDGSIQTVDTGFTVGEYDFSTPGKKTVTVYLSGGSVSFDVDVLLAGRCGESAYWSIVDGVFALSGSGEAEPVYLESWTKPWDAYKDSVTEIVIGEEISAIGYGFFRDFTAVTELTLPANVETVEMSAFADCKQLTDVHFAGSPDHVKESAFSGCEALKNVYTPCLDDWFNTGFESPQANPLYYADNLYVDGQRLSNVEVPELITTVYPCAFDFAFLKKVTLPDTVTKICEYAFRGCDELTALNMGKSVRTIDKDAFYGCDNLLIRCPVGAYAAVFAQENGIRYEYTDKVISIKLITPPTVTQYPLYGSIDTEGLTLEVTFEGDTVITTDHNFTLGGYCLSELGEAEITVYYKDKSATFTVNVVTGKLVATGSCGQDLEWSLDEYGVLNIYGTGAMQPATEGDELWLTYAEDINTVIIGEGVTAVCEEAFKYCRNLSVISIPTTLTRVGYSCFEGCGNIEKAYITDMAAYCNINFEHVLSGPLCHGARLILNGKAVKDLVIPEGVAAINPNQFYGFKYMTSLSIPSTVTSIGSFAFSNCNSLKELYIPKTLSHIEGWAFLDCNALSNVSGGKGLIYVGMDSFSGTPFCEKRTEKALYVGDILIDLLDTAKGRYSVDHGTKVIGMNCFDNCTEITHITLPNTVTSISWGAFTGCTGLVKVTIPESVTSIDITAFDKPYTTVIRCKEGSYAAEFAQLFGIPYEYYEVKTFSDVKDNAWYSDAVAYCVEQGYISGMTETTFAPNNNLTREQFVMILSQVAGVDTAQYKDLEDGFADTKCGKWYSGAVYWAVQNGYVSGVAKDRFGLGQNITREQLARLFYLYAESTGMDVTSRADLSKFADSSKISSWAAEQIEWAVSVGLISGMSETSLSPRGTATRAQAARIFMLFDKIR